MAAVTALSYSHVVIEVSDTARAADFYRAVLGAGDDVPWPEEGCRALALGDGQCLVLAASRAPRTFADTAAHVAYRAPPSRVSGIEARATAEGIAIARYTEDRAEEVAQNFYFADPDGNRIQIVTGGDGEGTPVIDHAAVLMSDIEWADEFWVEALGQPAVHRFGWATADFVRARAWGQGKEDMAPGTRRWDQRYRDIPGGKPGQGRKVARPNPQLFVRLGPAVVFGMFLAQNHFQEPPPDTACGTPRFGLRVADAALDGLAAALVAAGARVDGPVAAEGLPFVRTLRVRDRCGVFTEFVA